MNYFQGTYIPLTELNTINRALRIQKKQQINFRDDLHPADSKARRNRMDHDRSLRAHVEYKQWAQFRRNV